MGGSETGGNRRMPVGGDPVWHNACAIAAGLPTTAKWPEIVDAIYRLRDRAEGTAAPVPVPELRYFHDVPLFDVESEVEAS